MSNIEEHMTEKTILHKMKRGANDLFNQFAQKYWKIINANKKWQDSGIIKQSENLALVLDIDTFERFQAAIKSPEWTNYIEGLETEGVTISFEFNLILPLRSTDINNLDKINVSEALTKGRLTQKTNGFSLAAGKAQIYLTAVKHPHYNLKKPRHAA